MQTLVPSQIAQNLEIDNIVQKPFNTLHTYIHYFEHLFLEIFGIFQVIADGQENFYVKVEFWIVELFDIKCQLLPFYYTNRW